MIRLLAVLAGMFLGVTSVGGTLERQFRRPPQEARPWCYWWWQNGNADKASITADLEAMKALGFGGLLMSDARGYWDDENHVRTPKPKMEVMSPEWRALVQHAIRECNRLGLAYTMNVATCGGALKGPWKVGADAPKRLLCRVYLGVPESFETPDFPHWRDVATFTLEADPVRVAPLVARGWYEAGDGTRTQEAETTNEHREQIKISVVNVRSISTPPPLPPPAPTTFTVRFGSTVVPGHDCDVDVLDPAAITRHFNRFPGAIMDEAGPDLVGRDKTITHVYSVSWEGLVPMWSPNFAADFRTFAGYDIAPYLPVLAGFVPEGVDPDAFMTDYRRARNDMFRENFYGTLAKLAHARGIDVYSENGGPWRRDPEIFKEADQLAFFAVNDRPQGEFWVNERGGTDRIFNEKDPTEFFNTRGPVSAGHVYGKKIIPMESFTHMTRHWSLSPSRLRIAADRAFADGANHIVWHTFSLSPAAFGVPGYEYFAGTHINGNVTWHGEAKAFLDYLARCEAVLQYGDPVVDIAVKAGSTPYAHWGRWRDRTPDGETIPAGYNYDLVNDAEWGKSVVSNGWRVMASGMRYPAVRPALPDCEGPFAFAHRCGKDGDVYFLEGRAKADVTFRVSAEGRSAHLFDAVTGTITPLPFVATDDGRTRLALDLIESGSAIVFFKKCGGSARAVDPACDDSARAVPQTLAGVWSVSFAYHRLPHRRHLPTPRVMTELSDWTASADPDLKYFSGTATYKTVFSVADPKGFARLSLGELPSGVAHVFVNGTDCGTVWCAPWTVEIPKGTLRRGNNGLAIHYTNNWVNRLIGDCLLESEDRVTTSGLQYLKGGRVKSDGKKLNPYSGYCSEDPLQPSGLLGPVRLL